jgi:hypothetical protein
LKGINVTQTFSPLTIAAALAAAKKITGPYDLEGITPRQRTLTYAIPAHTRALTPYGASSDGIAGLTAAEINAELACRGADIRLDPWSMGTRSFGIAGVTDVTVNWPESAFLTTIEAKDGSRYPGFALGEAQTTRVVRVKGYPRPIVQAETLGGLDLRIAMMAPPRSQFDLTRSTLSLHRSGLDQNDLVGNSAHVPMVNLLAFPDISWLIGLKLRVAGAPDWRVAQAAQQVRFGMNQSGAQGTETVASRDETYIINQPFLLTLGRRDQADVPLFGAYITPDAWTDPGIPSTT